VVTKRELRDVFFAEIQPELMRRGFKLRSKRIDGGRRGCSSSQTFVHPDAVDLLRGNLMREPVGDNDPVLRQQVADYLATQNDLFARFHAARNPGRTGKDHDHRLAQFCST
jgi:hypothetical protein